MIKVNTSLYDKFITFFEQRSFEVLVVQYTNKLESHSETKSYLITNNFWRYLVYLLQVSFFYIFLL